MAGKGSRNAEAQLCGNRGLTGLCAARRRFRLTASRNRRFATSASPSPRFSTTSRPAALTGQPEDAAPRSGPCAESARPVRTRTADGTHAEWLVRRQERRGPGVRKPRTHRPPNGDPAVSADCQPEPAGRREPAGEPAVSDHLPDPAALTSPSANAAPTARPGAVRCAGGSARESDQRRAYRAVSDTRGRGRAQFSRERSPRSSASSCSRTLASSGSSSRISAACSVRVMSPRRS